MILLEETDEYVIECSGIFASKNNRHAYYFGVIKDKTTRIEYIEYQRIRYYDARDSKLLVKKLIKRYNKGE